MKWFQRLVLVVSALAVIQTAGVSAVAHAPQDPTSAIAAAVTPATVTIFVLSASGDTLAQGSGFIVRSDGVIVTNWHVLAGAVKATVVLSTREEYDRVSFLDGDSVADVALIKIPGFGLPTMPIRATIPAIGERLVVIGSPLGLSRTVTEGIVSAIRMVSGRQLIQISAPISHGSSGAAVIDGNGRAFAIATAAIEEGQQLNFAVPIRYAMGLLKPSLAERTLGEIFATASYPEAPLNEARTLVREFLAAANRGDLATMAQLWGTANSGPAASYMDWSELGKRLMIMALYLKHDSLRVISEDTDAAGHVSVQVRLVRGNASVVMPFVVVGQSQGRLLIGNVDLTATDKMDNQPSIRPRPSANPRPSLTGSYFYSFVSYDAVGLYLRPGVLHLGERIGIMAVMPSNIESPVFFVESSRTNAQGQVTLDMTDPVFDGFQTDYGLYLEVRHPSTRHGQSLRNKLVASLYNPPLSSDEGLYRVHGQLEYYDERNRASGHIADWRGELAVAIQGDSIWVDMYLANDGGGQIRFFAAGQVADSQFDLVSSEGKRLTGRLRSGTLAAEWIDQRDGDSFRGTLTAERF